MIPKKQTKGTKSADIYVKDMYIRDREGGGLSKNQKKLRMGYSRIFFEARMDFLSGGRGRGQGRGRAVAG